MEKKTVQLKEERGHSIIPGKELKCVWMTAGLISYKLCKYELQCEKCPLDWELRNLSTHSTLSSEASLNHSSSNAKQTLFFHAGHTWVEVEKVDEIRIGVDHFLGKMMEEVNAVHLPFPGSQWSQGEHICSIVQKEGIFEIISPVSGWVLSVNPKLRDHPELMIKDPFGSGYLLRMRPTDFERDQKFLISEELTFTWYQKEWEKFKMAVLEELSYSQESYRNNPIRIKMIKASIISELHHHINQTPITMQDGEININNIKKVIGPKRFIQIVNGLLHDGEKGNGP